jgi:hypothetical protein
MKKKQWNVILVSGLLISLSISLFFVFHTLSDAQKSSQVFAARPKLTVNLPIFPTITYLPAISKSCPCYFIDSIDGSDSNSGTQPDKPWKTLSRLAQANLQPGDIVYLKRGSNWNEKIRLYASGQAGKPITITAYGSGEAPILSNSGGITSYESTLSLNGNFFIIDNLQFHDSAIGIEIYSDHNII